MLLSNLLLVLSLIFLHDINARIIELGYFDLNKPIKVYYHTKKNFYLIPKQCFDNKTCLALSYNYKSEIKEYKKPSKNKGINLGEDICKKLKQAKPVIYNGLQGQKLVMCKFKDGSAISVGYLTSFYY